MARLLQRAVVPGSVFSFDVQECLSQWPSEEDGLILTKNRGKLPVMLGQLPPQRSGPHNNDKAKFEEQEIFVANALGFPDRPVF